MSKNSLILILVVISFVTQLYAVGEKPKYKSEPGQITEQAVAPAPSVLPTAEQQFEKAYQEYLQAKRMNYSRNNQKAIKSFKDYLQYYPKAGKRVDALFYLEKLYQKEMDINNQEKYLDLYWQEATTGNYYYKYAEIDNALLDLHKGQKEQAILKLENMDKIYSGKDEFMKREIYRVLLEGYEMGQPDDRIIRLYKYYIEHKELVSKNYYYLYCYKLAVIYYNQHNIPEARKYFQIVAKAKDFDTTYIIKISQDYLNKISLLEKEVKNKKVK